MREQERRDHVFTLAQTAPVERVHLFCSQVDVLLDFDRGRLRGSFAYFHKPCHRRGHLASDRGSMLHEMDNTRVPDIGVLCLIIEWNVSD